MHSMQLWTSPKRRRISSRHSNPSTVEDRQIRCPASLEFLSSRAVRTLHRSPATVVRPLRSILFGSWTGVGAKYATDDAG